MAERFISRDELERRLDAMCAGCMISDQNRLDILAGLTDADVRPVVRGKWVKRGGTINCSICKHCSWSESFEYTVMNFNCCPNCGADMKGEDDG